MTARARTRRTVGGLLPVVLLVLTGCSGSGHASAPLPPRQVNELAPIFQPALTPLGLRLTRAALVDSSEGSTTKHHLAVYVEPTGPWTEGRYVATIVPLTKVFAPSIFRRWSQLSSFDVCQEPPPGVDDRPEPASVTTVNLTRQASDDVDWDSADLATLLRAAGRKDSGASLDVSTPLHREPAFAAAQARAEAQVKGGD